MRPVIAASIYCRWKDKILMIERNKQPFAGYWVAPGGKVETGESPYQAAMRELEEETGLCPERAVLRGIVSETSPHPSWQWLIFFYVVTEFTGKLTEKSAEGELRWWPLSQLPQHALPPPDRIFMPPILNMTAPIYQGHFLFDSDEKLITVIDHTSEDASADDVSQSSNLEMT